MTNKKTLVIGASTNPARYSYLAVHSLRRNGHDVVALAKKEGCLLYISIQTNFPENKDIHTVTMYVGPNRQDEYYQQIIDLKPERVIFNPGTENPLFKELLKENEIEAVEACTLVMLNTGQF